MYYLLGICLLFAAFLTINAAASGVASILWRLIERPTRRWRAVVRANLLFALRFIPLLSSFIAVACLLLPAYIENEPQQSVENVSLKLALLSLLSISGITLALWRTLATWRATRQLTADWLRRAEPIQLAGIRIPAYKLKHPFPVVAIVGALSPRLFIAAHLFTSLDAEELSAALLHEKAHLVARDNSKRALLRACCDVLGLVPTGRALDRAWTKESEAAADEYAARAGGSAFALSLATALIKIARLVPESAKPTMPAGVFLLGEANAPIASRVERLTQLAENVTAQHPATARLTSLTGYLILFVFFASLFLLITQTHLLMTIHTAIEHFVAALQ